jgi:hypothetical protein
LKDRQKKALREDIRNTKEQLVRRSVSKLQDPDEMDDDAADYYEQDNQINLATRDDNKSGN